MPDCTHELVLVYGKGALEHGERIDLDDLARWSVISLVPQGATRDLASGPHSAAGANAGLKRSYSKAHPAVFPVRLPEIFVRQLTASAESVADPFGGAGSTLIACENLSRRCFAMEIDPGYCDVIVDRWERHTGKTAERTTTDDAAIEAVA